jgi:hypothetical protein
LLAGLQTRNDAEHGPIGLPTVSRVTNSVAPFTVSVVVSIQMRKMFVEVRKMFSNARRAEQDVRERQASRNF